MAAAEQAAKFMALSARIANSYRAIAAMPLPTRMAANPAILMPAVAAVLGAIAAGLMSIHPTLFIASALLLWGLVYRRRERDLARFGITGFLVLLVLMVLRLAALGTIGQLTRLHLFEAFIAAEMLGAAAIVAVAWTTTPAPEAFPFASTLRSRDAVIAMLEATAAALCCGLRIGAALVIGTYLILRLVRGWMLWRWKGATMRGLSVAAIAIESFVLVMLAAMRNQW